MEKNLFKRLVESMTQMSEVERDERPAARVSRVEVKRADRLLGFPGSREIDECSSGDSQAGAAKQMSLERKAL